MKVDFWLINNKKAGIGIENLGDEIHCSALTVAHSLGRVLRAIAISRTRSTCFGAMI